MKIIQTSEICPSQWEIGFDNGDIGFVRYKHGYLRWGRGKTLGDAILNMENHWLDGDNIGDGYGILPQKDMEKILKDFLCTNVPSLK